MHEREIEHKYRPRASCRAAAAQPPRLDDWQHYRQHQIRSLGDALAIVLGIAKLLGLLVYHTPQLAAISPRLARSRPVRQPRAYPSWPTWPGAHPR
jgi:hypothetical protein